jgi:hypothetical protein
MDWAFDGLLVGQSLAHRDNVLRCVFAGTSQIGDEGPLLSLLLSRETGRLLF